ncbi:hypothetical protein OG696_36015 [Streptomyces sp. NBC_00656]|uniref:hypothetical protein n=1 Tax=Streptomyces sp. NBC_00656 TaxID=2903668 RepID=UPI0032487FBF
MSLFDRPPPPDADPPLPQDGPASPVQAGLQIASFRLRRRFALVNAMSVGTLVLASVSLGDALSTPVFGPLRTGLLLFMAVVAVLLVTTVQYDRACRKQCDGPAAVPDRSTAPTQGDRT